jgi:hypothetical protein
LRRSFLVRGTNDAFRLNQNNVCSLSPHRLTRRINDPHQPECPNAEVVSIAEANTVRISGQSWFQRYSLFSIRLWNGLMSSTDAGDKIEDGERMLRTAADGVTDPR